MDNSIPTNLSWTPQQSAEHIRQKINLPLLKEMLTTFFQAKASEKGQILLRRPPIALRLLDGEDHVYTIRPGWNKPGFRFDGQQPGSFDFSRLFVDAVHQQKGKCVKFRFDESSLTMTSWYKNRYFEALDNFAQTSREFVLFPWQVFSRSKDHCCICGRHLTDEISRGRGVGPECLRMVSNCFGKSQN